MKVTKKTLQKGMLFKATNEIKVCPFVFDTDGYLTMEHGTLIVSEEIEITEVLKKYPTGAGYSGEMVRFCSKSIPDIEYVSFWSDFKKVTNLVQ